MSTPDESHAPAGTSVPDHYNEPVLLEDDETVPPRPEEEIADVGRSEPDRTDGGRSEASSAVDPTKR